MGDWVCCPTCGKHLIQKTKGTLKVEGGSFGAWCKRCKCTIEIYGDCETRVAKSISA